jgi:hypothetical protein
MQGQTHEVVKGVNDFLDNQKAEADATGADIRVWLTTFDTQQFEVFVGEDVRLAGHVRPNQVYIGGGTNLLDAEGKMLGQAQINAATRNLVVIYTDGKTFGDREFTKKQIADLTKKLEDTGDWQFMYLGAELGDFADADAIGVASASTIRTSKQAGSVGATFASVTQTANYYRNTNVADSKRLMSRGGIVSASVEDAAVDWSAAKGEDPTSNDVDQVLNLFEAAGVDTKDSSKED